MPELVFINGSSSGQHVELAPEGTRLGRHGDCAAVIPDTQVSGFHCEILLDRSSGWIVSDLGSSNGTFLNDARITSAPLADGDIVRVGDTQLQFLASPAGGNGAVAADARRSRPPARWPPRPSR